VIVTGSLVHVHIGCTKGDFPLPALLDSEGRFNVPGSYILRAYPVQLGPSLPARFAGIVRGSVLTLSVAVDDTVDKKLVALGPVTITLRREPNLGPCPICESAPRYGGAHRPCDGPRNPTIGRVQSGEQPGSPALAMPVVVSYCACACVRSAPGLARFRTTHRKVGSRGRAHRRQRHQSRQVGAAARGTRRWFLS
jgi:hypothetical protein